MSDTDSGKGTLMCRLCLSTEGLMEEIFGSDDDSLTKTIFECTSIKVRDVKKFPQFICGICQKELKVWQKFKQKCLRTNEILKCRYPELFLNEENQQNFDHVNDTNEKEFLLLENVDDESEEELFEVYKEIDDKTHKEKVPGYDDIIESNANEKEIEIELISKILSNVNERITKENEKNDNLSNSHVIEIETVADDNLKRKDELKRKILGNSQKILNKKYQEKSLKVSKSQKINQHKIKNHQELKLLNKISPQKSNIENKVILPKQKKMYNKTCHVCGKSTQNINSHMLVHTDIRPFRCSYCGKGFRTKSNYKHHVNIHTGEKPYECKICHLKYADPGGLRSHMIRHTGERKYQCDICGKSFSYSHALGLHRRTHTQDRRYSCDFCVKRFLSKSALTKHVCIHTGEKPYKCDKCSKGFSSSGNLTVHKRSHTKEKPYACEICMKSFSYKSVLVAHERRHYKIFVSGKKSQENYTIHLTDDNEINIIKLNHDNFKIKDVNNSILKSQFQMLDK